MDRWRDTFKERKRLPKITQQAELYLRSAYMLCHSHKLPMITWESPNKALFGRSLDKLTTASQWFSIGDQSTLIP
jgi:hypothetical protein